MNTMTTILDRNERNARRADAVLGMIRLYPNSRANHYDLKVTDIEVYESPMIEDVGMFVKTKDMETFLHVVSVVTREAAMNGYEVQINQYGWGVGFIFTQSFCTEVTK